MTIESRPLVVGIPGPSLSAMDREIIDEVRPLGVVLFSRNIQTPRQTRDLTAELGALDEPPFIAVDLEGGSVNRLRPLWGDLPSPSEAAGSGRSAVRALGDAAGAACRSLGIHLDLAPVVDLSCRSGLVQAQGRCLGEDPARVVTLARLFHAGLSTWGVGGCLKHFPGIGEATVDTHDELPVLPDGDPDARLAVFADLSPEIPVVMMGHVVSPDLGDASRPASLSGPAVARAADLPGSPVVLSDDLEMGALAGLGDLPDLVVDALRARNHGALVCSEFGRLVEIAERLRSTAADQRSFTACTEVSAARLGTLRRDLVRASAAVPAPDDETVAQLWERARRSVSTSRDGDDA